MDVLRLVGQVLPDRNLHIGLTTLRVPRLLPFEAALRRVACAASLNCGVSSDSEAHYREDDSDRGHGVEGYAAHGDDAHEAQPTLNVPWLALRWEQRGDRRGMLADLIKGVDEFINQNRENRIREKIVTLLDPPNGQRVEMKIHFEIRERGPREHLRRAQRQAHRALQGAEKRGTDTARRKPSPRFTGL